MTPGSAVGRRSTGSSSSTSSRGACAPSSTACLPMRALTRRSISRSGSSCVVPRMTASAYSSVCSSPGTACDSQLWIAAASFSKRIRSCHNAGRAASWTCHQLRSPPLRTSARISSRRWAGTRYSPSRAETSSGASPRAPVSIRLSLLIEIPRDWDTSAALSPVRSRSSRSSPETRLTRAGTPLRSSMIDLSSLGTTRKAP
nr:hypothetical protein [Actinopolyspora halophila]